MDNIDAQLTLLRKNIADLEEKKRQQQLAEIEKKNTLLNQLADLEKNNQIKIDSFLPDEYEYERMQGINANYEDMTYYDFVIWNHECLRNMTVEDRISLVWLCKKIKNNTINLVDMESCCEFTASGFYFDKNANICITNPR
jgi:hypothetical protein